MNIDDAAYHTAHDYPGGCEALAPRLGMSGAVLRNKVNRNNTTHHLTLREAVAMSDLTGDERMLYAWAARRGKVVVDSDGAGLAQVPSLFACVLDLSQGQGEMSRVLRDALSDGRISPNELDQIEKHAIDLQRRITELARSARAAVPQALES